MHKKRLSDFLYLMLVVKVNLLSGKSYLQKMEQILKFSMLFVSGLPFAIVYVLHYL